MDYLILCAAAFAAGVVNAIAGGGTLLTFPALDHFLKVAGIADAATAAVFANGTSTIALFPASAASVWAYRREMTGVRDWIRLLIVPSFIGGLIGSLLVTALDPKVFERLVPWLIFTAALLFATQPLIAKFFGIGLKHAPATTRTKIGVFLFQCGVGLYGGYFGAGIGILMLSGLAMLGLSDIHRMNGIKAFLASTINGITVVVFIVQAKVYWTYALPMIAAGIVGGYTGAHVAQRLNKTLVRGLVVVIGFSLATYYFYQRYFAGN